MPNQVVRPANRREFMSKLIEPAYDPRYPIQEEVFSEPAKLGQPEINRAKEVSVKNDNIRDFKIGIQDFDEAIMYYFKEVLKPSVIQNNTRLNVPVLYGDPENWKSVQADGYYRDANGKLLAPLIMFKRSSVTQNRGLGFKIDGNVTKNMQLFQKKFSKRNIYSNFSTINNRAPETEYIAAITPDYVTVEYDCVVWTYFVEQMDELIESINFASRTYWGDSSKFQFYSSIESFNESITYEVGEDRAIKNTFTITLNGYIIPESINKTIASMNRVYGVSQVVFGMEVANSSAEVTAVKNTKTGKSLGRTLVQDGTNVIVNQTVVNNSGFDPAIGAYLANNKQVTGTYLNATTVVFPNGWATAPSPLPANSADNFNFFVNGMYVEPTSIVSFTDGVSTSTLVINSTLLGYGFESSDVVLGIGKFN
jgi:hypothetical protein